MYNVKEKVIVAAILSLLSSGTYAKIFPDQIVFDQLGEDQCRSGYRPLDRTEARQQTSALLARMSTWQITGLKDDWVIMGPGYHGKIKRDIANHSTWCYPVESNAGLPDYPAQSVPEGDEVSVQYDLVNDRDAFIRPLSYLAHYLGYAWLGGNHSRYVGEDMVVERKGDGWLIQGNNSGSCSGYRCDEKTKITVNNFAYTLNDKDFWHGSVTESERELVDVISAKARNYSSVPQQVVIDLKLSEATNWSKTNTYGFSQAVQTENEFQWPLVGKTKLSIRFEANQSFSSSDGGSTSKQVTLQVRPMVPAQSEIPIRVELYRSTISYPYRFGANISYDVNFNGFLRWSGNAWHSHPNNRPYLSHTFTMGRGSNKKSNVRYQWDHRYIPGETKWWDWSWAINKYGLNRMQYAAGASLRPFHSYVSGDFYAESQYAGTMEIGEESPIEMSKLNSESQDVSLIRAGEVEVVSDFDREKLERLGFRDADLNVSLVE